MRRRAFTTLVVSGVLFSAVLHAPSAQAAAGDLDPTFGNGGLGMTDFGVGMDDQGYGIAIQPDGKILESGYSCDDACEGGFIYYALARYNADGTLDTTFGIRGKARAYVDNGAGFGAGLQTDGKIVVVGEAVVGGYTVQGLARFLPSGRLDRTFGNQGTVANSAGLPAFRALIQPDGKIVTIGSDLLARYNSDGTLDSRFGNGGIVKDPVPGEGQGGALDLRGRILVAGWTDVSPVEFVVARYTRRGTLDSTFGSGGIVETAIGESAEAHAITIQPDNKIVAVGQQGNSTGSRYDFGAVRYLSNGSLDPTFGTGGIVTTDVPGGNGTAEAAALQGDGKIVVVGSLAHFPASEPTVARFLPDGELDQTFGTNGLVITTVGEVEDPEAGAHAVVLQTDGKIVAAGTARNLSTYYDFAALRYQAA